MQFPKRRPNHAQYLAALRRMTPEARLAKAFELSDFSKTLFLRGLRRRFPDLPPEDFVRLANDRLEKCRSRRY